MSPDPVAKQGLRTTTADFESALVVAESLLDQADRARDRIRIMRAGQVGLPAIAALALAISTGAAGMSALNIFITSLVCGVISLLVIAWTEVALVMPTAKRFSRDERAMLEIVGPLRELLRSVATDEDWSASHQRFVKARIARFPIAPSRSFL